MQHKPYIVELSFMETQKSHDSINEGPSLTTEGLPQQLQQIVSKVVQLGRYGIQDLDPMRGYSLLEVLAWAVTHVCR